ncbi:hypothetical protein V8C34DRAFT_299697 [Trichoderma compactum]
MLRFLRNGPLSRARLFDKYIVGPMREETDDSLRNLRLFLRLVCLRRGDEHLNFRNQDTKLFQSTYPPQKSPNTKTSPKVVELSLIGEYAEIQT